MAEVHLDELMTDDDFLKTVEQMSANGDTDIGDLLKAMNENRIISWEEAERILQDTDNRPIKSSLPEQTRPTEPDNDTDVDRCIQRLLNNDPTLKEVNLNNMKRTPVPQIRRLIEALAYNEYCERISFANMGLYDNDMAVLITVVEMNQALKKLNLETNYLSGDFFAKLFKAALANMTLEEIKAVNQGTTFSTVSEKEIIEAVVANNGLIKVSVNLRLPEGRHKIEHATLRNGEYRRMLRREAALRAKAEEEEKRKAEEAAKATAPKPAKEPAKPPAKAPPRALPSSLVNPTVASSSKEKEKVQTPTKKVWTRPEPVEPPNNPEKVPPKKIWTRPEPIATPKSSETPPTRKIWTRPQAEEPPKSPEKPPTTIKKFIRNQPEPEKQEAPKRLQMRGWHPLARRQSNADSSSTPVLQMAGGSTPISQLSEGLRKTANGELIRRSSVVENGDLPNSPTSPTQTPPVKKLSGMTTASVFEKAVAEPNEKPADNDSPIETVPPKLTWAERRALAAAKAEAARAEAAKAEVAKSPITPPSVPPKRVLGTSAGNTAQSAAKSVHPPVPLKKSAADKPSAGSKLPLSESCVPPPAENGPSELIGVNGEEKPKKKKIIKKKVIRKKKKPVEDDAPNVQKLEV